jgi:HK97 family phage prohead protease
MSKALNKDAPKMKMKRLQVELTDAVVTKGADGGECIITGYANTSSKDRVGDVVDPKAFEKSLPTYMKNPVLLANHNWEDIIGLVQSALVDEKGLKITARISDTRADIKTLIREKCLRTFSIGYNEIDADYDEATKTKFVKELELLEISVVTVPANAEALFELAADKPDTEAQPEKAAFVSNMKEFVGEVEKTLARKLNGQEVGALCGYFIEHKGEKMKTKELIELLQGKKSAPAPVADAKQDEGQPAEGQPDPAKALEQKLEAIGQGMAKILELLDKLTSGAAEPEKADKPEEDKKPEDEKPAEEEKPEDEKASDEEEDKDEEEDCEKELDEEIEKELAALEAEEAELADL